MEKLDKKHPKENSDGFSLFHRNLEVLRSGISWKELPTPPVRLHPFEFSIPQSTIEKCGLIWRDFNDGIEGLFSDTDEFEWVFRRKRERRQYFLPKSALKWTKILNRKVPSKEDMSDILADPIVNHLAIHRHYGIIREWRSEGSGMKDKTMFGILLIRNGSKEELVVMDFVTNENKVPKSIRYIAPPNNTAVIVRTLEK